MLEDGIQDSLLNRESSDASIRDSGVNIHKFHESELLEAEKLPSFGERANKSFSEMQDEVDLLHYGWVL